MSDPRVFSDGGDGPGALGGSPYMGGCGCGSGVSGGGYMTAQNKDTSVFDFLGAANFREGTRATKMSDKVSYMALAFVQLCVFLLVIVFFWDLPTQWDLAHWTTKALVVGMCSGAALWVATDLWGLMGAPASSGTDTNAVQ